MLINLLITVTDQNVLHKDTQPTIFLCKFSNSPSLYQLRVELPHIQLRWGQCSTQGGAIEPGGGDVPPGGHLGGGEGEEGSQQQALGEEE